MKRNKRNINSWLFQIEDELGQLSEEKKVQVPHTWGTDPDFKNHLGLAHYFHDFPFETAWANKRIWLEFGAVYHSATVYLNGNKIIEHNGSGYTPFTVELTPFLNTTAINRLKVTVSNQFSNNILPYQKSYDWANDGGIIRDVSLYSTSASKIQTTTVNALPIITTDNNRQEQGDALFEIKTTLDEVLPTSSVIQWALLSDKNTTDSPVASGQLKSESSTFQVKMLLSHITYWHFDAPHLYTLTLKVVTNGLISDEIDVTIGFREFVTRDSQFFLNGEPVRISGTEWMPGSNPVFGMAEPTDELKKMLVLLKESNCVYTRFHWQQADYIYDWCDRNGILVQEEIPFWGTDPELIEPHLLEIAKNQITETLDAHRNHPCIISWGIGNELNGQSQDTVQYVKDTVAFIRKLDPHRLVNYVSNTYLHGPTMDSVIFGDVLMINEYAGTWFPDHTAEKIISELIAANPGKVIVPSEFGLCEPAFSGGDQRRESIIKEKLDIYRNYPEIGGTIYFSLNDYRTHMGEAGSGLNRKRIHGSTDLCGQPKPSYWAIQKECAPFQISWSKFSILLSARIDLPSYVLKNYTITFYDQLGNQLAVQHLPEIRPAQELHIELPPGTENIEIFRPNGFTTGLFSRHSE